MSFEKPNQIERGPAPQKQEKKPQVTKCYVCNGTCKKHGETCKECQGSGKITVMI